MFNPKVSNIGGSGKVQTVEYTPPSTAVNAGDIIIIIGTVACFALSDIAVGATPTQVDDSSGFGVEVRIRDYLGPIDELIAGGIDMPPRRGDQIVEADGTVYELMDLGQANHFNFSGPGGNRVRIHTKQVAAD